MPEPKQTDSQEDVQRGGNGGLRPVPDPSVLTTEALQREIGALKELIELRVAGVQRLLEQRIVGVVAVREEEFEGINEKLSRIAAVTEERFSSIAIQFAERDTRQERETRDNTVKVDAAFAAAKEASAKQDEANQKAIDKAEQQTTEKITKQGELLQTTTNAIADKLDDLKQRVTTVEQQKVGRDENNNAQRADRTEHRTGTQPFQVAGLVIAGSFFTSIVVVVLNLATGS